MTERPATLPEYADNPFIACLPVVVPQKQIYGQLEEPPRFDIQERQLPAFLRKHCIARLANCFLPQSRQVALAERFGLLLRQGYVGRNPSTHEFIHHLHNGLDRIQARSIDAPVAHPVLNTASSFSLLGCPGGGKTVAMNRVLRLYPQVIHHDAPFSVTQIVWLRLEAPALGSLKQLCIDFFDAIDQLIGTDYVKRYATGVTVEQMVPYMAHVAHLHALGALVIDEIQHLKGVKVGADALMKFLVRLVNTIGVPVIPIGTLSALSILQGSFSQARRASGLGSLLWDRMAKDAVWDHFLTQLWRYQWTSEPTELTPPLSEVMYDLTQGVTDLAVKLFMLAQLRVVSASEVRRHQSESLTERLFRQVGYEEFAMVKPMIDALRMNDKARLRAFEDLRPFSEHIQTMLGASLTSPSTEPVPSIQPLVVGPAATPGDLAHDLMQVLERLGLARDVAQAAIQKAIAEHTIDDPLALLRQLGTTLATRSPARAASKVKSKRVVSTEWLAEDLRRVVKDAKREGHDAYDALLAAGVVRAPLLDFGS